MLNMSVGYQVAFVAVFFVVLIRAAWVLRQVVEKNVERFGAMAVHQFLVCVSVWWAGTFIWHLYLFFSGEPISLYMGGHGGRG